MAPTAFSRRLSSESLGKSRGSRSRIELEALEEEKVEEKSEAPATKKRATPKGKEKEAKDEKKEDSQEAEETKPKRQRKAKADKAAEEESQEAEEAKPKRQKKEKPTGPYTKYKETGSIPEPELKRVGPKDFPAGRQRLVMLAWNIASLRAFMKSRLSELQKIVEKETPHFLGLLEHKLQEGSMVDDCMKELLEALPDYEVGAVNCSTAKKGYSGTLVLVRKDGPKPLKVKSKDLETAANEGRLVVAEYEDFDAVLAYVPNSGDGLKRLDERTTKWDPELRECLVKMAKKKPVVLIGDLNVAHRDEDIWNVEAPHVAKSAGTTPEERESFAQLLKAGFVDGFVHSHPEALGAFTYWSQRAKNRPVNKGLRLDYVLVTPGLIGDAAAASQVGSGPLLVETFHLPEMAPGDHCPVGAVLALATAEKGGA